MDLPVIVHLEDPSQVPLRDDEQLVTKIPLLNIQMVHSREENTDHNRFYIRTLFPQKTDFECNSTTCHQLVQESNRHLLTLFNALSPEGITPYIALPVAVLQSLSLLMNAMETIPKVSSLILKERVLDELQNIGRHGSVSSVTLEAMKNLSLRETYSRDQTPKVYERLLSMVSTVETNNVQITRLCEHLITPKNKLQGAVMTAQDYKDRKWYLYLIYTIIVVVIVVYGFYAAVQGASK